MHHESAAPPKEPSALAAAPDSLQILWELAQSARAVHERSLEAALGGRDTSGSCLFASVLLASTINRFSSWLARVRGGSWLAGTERHGHYWVQAGLHGAEFVLDISADQFGAPAVLVLPLPAADRYLPETDDVIAEHIRLAGLPDVVVEKAPALAPY